MADIRFFAYDRSTIVAPPTPAVTRRPRQTLHRGEAGGRVSVAGPGRRERAEAHSDDPRPGGDREPGAGASRDAAGRRGAEDRRPGEPEPTAGRLVDPWLRSAAASLGGSQIGPDVTPPPPRAAAVTDTD